MNVAAIAGAVTDINGRAIETGLGVPSAMYLCDDPPEIIPLVFRQGIYAGSVPPGQDENPVRRGSRIRDSNSKI